MGLTAYSAWFPIPSFFDHMPKSVAVLNLADSVSYIYNNVKFLCKVMIMQWKMKSFEVFLYMSTKNPQIILAFTKTLHC